MRDLTRLLLPDVRELLAAGDTESVLAELGHLHPADIADLVSYLDDEYAVRVFRALAPPQRRDVIKHLEEPVQVKLVELIGKGPMIAVIEDMSSDDRTDLMQALSEQSREMIMPLLAQAERNETKKLLSYEEDSAGSVMSTEYAAVNRDLTVDQALALLRRIATSRETIYYIYVLDRERRLIGVVSLRDLVLARGYQKIGDIMETEIIRAHVEEDQEEVAATVEKYDLLALPIVDGEGRLVGIVTQDDVMDVLKEEATEDAQRMAAMDPLEDPYLYSGFWQLVRKRGVWLLFLLVAGLGAGEVLLHFEGLWQQIPILALFFPIIIAAGGNTGSQSSVLVIRSLALGEIELRHFLRVVFKEGCQGLALGALLGLVLGGIAFLRYQFWEPEVAAGMAAFLPTCAAIAMALLLVVVLGTLLGSALPLVFKWWGLDPAIMSAPSIAAFMDVMGLAIYFLTIKVVLGI